MVESGAVLRRFAKEAKEVLEAVGGSVSLLGAEALQRVGLLTSA